MNLTPEEGERYRAAYYRARAAKFSGMPETVPPIFAAEAEKLGWKNGIKDAKGELRLDADMEWDD